MVLFKGVNQEFEREITPSRLNWIILNALCEFDNKPELIEVIYNKLTQIKNHPIAKKISNPAITFWDYYYYAVKEFYPTSKKFPDPKAINVRFKSKEIVIKEDYKHEYSIQIYEEFVKWLDIQLIHLEKELVFDDPHCINVDKANNFNKLVNNFIGRNNVIDDVTKDYLLNMYDEYSKEYKGIKTHIPLIDNVIGVLGHQSIAVLGGPNKHGKSTLALTFAYNAAVFGGKVIDYVSYETPLKQMWFNLVAIESYYTGDNLNSADIKQCLLDEQGKILYRKNMSSLLKKLNDSGGLIKIYDATKLLADNFEELKSKVEKVAEERGRPADLIVFDNVDSFKRYRGRSIDVNDNVNNMIVELDDFSKTYYNNTGTTFLLLTQLSQEGIFKISQKEERSKNEGNKKKEVTVDNTVFRQYKSLGDRCTVGMVIYSNEQMRAMGRANIYFTANRERETPTVPIKIAANYAQSMMGGEAVVDLSKKQRDINAYKQREDIDKSNETEEFEDYVDEDDE